MKSNLIKINNLNIGKGGTLKEILDKWERIGFLDRITKKETKLKVALVMEEVAYILLNNKIKNKYDYLEMVVFPVSRRVVTKLYDRKITNKIKKDNLVKSLDGKFIINELNRLLKFNYDFFKKIYNGYEKNIDIEAEATAFISEKIESIHYLKNFNKTK